MIKVRSATGTPSLHTLRRMLVVSLALGTMLMCVLALHSIVGPFGGSTTATAAIGQSANVVIGSPADAGSAATVTPAGPGPTFLSIDCDQNCTIGGGAIAMVMVCLIVIALAATVLLARFSAIFDRLRDKGRSTILLVPEVKNHIYLPSLTVLSISRT